MSIVLSMLAGLAAGMGHVLSGPDHLAAIAPLAVDQRRKPWRVGLLWGIGHSSGVWILAILALLFREALPIDWLSMWGERVVGFVLIGIGLWGLRGLARSHIHVHEHEHDGVRHRHIHMHADGVDHDHTHEHSHSHAALGIGTLHGLAGTSHLLGVLPALLLPTRGDAVGYVGAFGIGSIVAMSVFAWVMGLFAHRSQHFGPRSYRWFLGACCAAAIVVGCYWCVASFTAVQEVH